MTEIIVNEEIEPFKNFFCGRFQNTRLLMFNREDCAKL